MKVKRFEDLIAWQKAQDLAVDIYKTFSKSNDFGFKNQISRAVISISNNIAEGFNRGSNVQFSYFLRVSRSSCDEVKSMVYLAERLGYISIDKKVQYINDSEEISKILTGLLNYLKKSNL